MKCYFGTYASDGGEGVYLTEIDPKSGGFSPPRVFCREKNSKYLICEDKSIFTLFEGDGASGLAVYGHTGELVDKIEYEQTASCHVVKCGNDIYTANYHEGTISKLEFTGGKLYLRKRLVIQEKAGCHQVIVYKNLLFVPCLLLDKLYILDNDLTILNSIELPLGSGPRHGVLSLDQNYLYLVGELNDTLYTFSLQKDSPVPIHELPLLPKEAPRAKGTAAIRISRDGRALMVSIRNANRIAVVDISEKIPKIIQSCSSMGDHPRDILNISNDEYVIAAHRTDGKVVLFPVDNHKILEACSEIVVNGAVSIGIIEE